MKKFSQIWTLTLLLKLVLAYFIPMTPDECYYWVWSQKLQLSYLDHPPFIAWLFKLSSILPPLAGLSAPPRCHFRPRHSLGMVLYLEKNQRDVS